MKIAVVYFEQKLEVRRAHHSVRHDMLAGWVRSYRRSGTVAEPHLLVDRATPVPSVWPFGHTVVEDDAPPRMSDVLHKVGWMKAQAFALLGECVVMDLDALPLSPLDGLRSAAPIAMAPDEGTVKTRPWAVDWPAAARKYNAGVTYLNSPAVLPAFRSLWERWEGKYLGVTYFDEVIFSSLVTDLGGAVLPESYNTTWAGFRSYPGAKVLHFSGDRKVDLVRYLGPAL